MTTEDYDTGAEQALAQEADLREREGAQAKTARIRLCGRIRDAVRTELYLYMRFLELVCGRIEFRMDLTKRTWRTVGALCY